MDNSPFDTSEFKALQQKWYRELKTTGFVDQERADGTLRDEHHTKEYRKLAPQVRDAVSDYFHQATTYLAETEFSDGAEKSIWEAHAEGLSVREIATRLEIGKTTVQRYVAKHRARAGLKRAGRQTL